MDVAPPPASVVAPVGQAPFASGRAPDWSLTRSGDAVVLAIAGEKPLRLSASGWRDRPTGRLLRLTGPDGAEASLMVIHALCPGERPTRDLMVRLSAGRRTLHGCLHQAAADRPYPGR